MTSRAMYLMAKAVEKMANNAVVNTIDDEMAEFFDNTEVAEEEATDLCDWASNLETNY